MNEKDKGKKDPASHPDKDSRKVQNHPAGGPLQDLIERYSDSLPPDLISELEPIIKKVPDPETAGQIIQVVIQHTQYGEGHPFIPAKLLKEYHDIDPEFSKQVLDAFWEEMRHRQAQEQKSLEANIQLEQYEAETSRQVQARGQHYGLLIGLSAFGAAIIAILLDNPIVAGVFGAAGITGLVSAFLRSGRRDEDTKNRENRDETKE